MIVLMRLHSGLGTLFSAQQIASKLCLKKQTHPWALMEVGLALSLTQRREQVYTICAQSFGEGITTGQVKVIPLHPAASSCQYLSLLPVQNL